MDHPRASWTDPGRRQTNQDAAIRASLGADVEVAAVADGMGGHLAGEVASREALRALVAALQRGAGLREAVRAANESVYRRALQSPECQGMGTTLVVYLRRGQEYEIANVGDSRAYLVEGGTITRITRDHSFVAEAVASGELTEAEAMHSRWRNALTRAIGTDPEVEADLFGPFTVDRPHAVLLCTDGFHRWLAEAEVPEVIAAAPDPGTAVANLGQAALRGGSDDNITLLLIEVKPEPAVNPNVAAAPVRERELPPRLSRAERALRPGAPPGLMTQFVGRRRGGREGHEGREERSGRLLRRARWRGTWEPLAFMVVVLGVLYGLTVLVLRFR
jgi:protein phosphatase